MLVLSRKVGEKVRISNDIVVTVLKCQGNSVRIGIEAPAQIKVLRAELPPLDTAGLSETREKKAGHALRPRAIDARQRLPLSGERTSPLAPTARDPQRWSIANMQARAESAATSRVHSR